MNAQSSFLVAGLLSGIASLLFAAIYLLASTKRSPSDRSFCSGLVVGTALIGSIFFFISAIVK